MADVVSIRPGTRDDVDAIEGMWRQLAVQHAAYDAERWDFAPDAAARWRRAFVETLDQEGTLVLVAQDGEGQLLGFVWATVGEAPPQMAYRRIGTINDVFVVPDGRSRGVGRRLMTAAFDELKRRGADCAMLLAASANARALEFYRRLGMTATSQQMFTRL